MRWIPAALFVALPGLLVAPALGSGKFLYGNDVIGGFFHLRGTVGKALAEGRLPVWDGHAMAGAPLLAAMHAGVLYPPTWASAFLDPGLFWTLTAWLHLSLAGFFAFAWLGRGLGLSRAGALAGALLFMLSGFMTAHIHGGHIPHVSAAPWAAAVLWRLERFLSGPTLRRGLLLAAALALMILAGFPQFVLIAGLAVGGRLVHFVVEEKEGRRARALVSGRAAAALALAGLLAAPQLLPTLELIGHGQRVSVNKFDFVASFSVSPGNLFALLAPTFFGDGRQVPVWSHGFIAESSGFVGIAGLALAALGVAGRRKQRFLWAGLAALALLLALGKHSPVFTLFYHVVPGVSLFRVPARYLFLFTIALAPLAAMGVERLCAGDERVKRHSLVIASVALALLLAAATVGVSLRGEPEWWKSLTDGEAVALKAEQGDAPAAGPAAREMASGSMIWAAVCLAAAAGSLLLNRGPATAAALALLLAGELWICNSRYYVPHPRAGMEWPPEFVSAVRNHPRHPFRIATVTAAQTGAIGMSQLAGIDHVGGYDPMMLRRYTEYVNVARGKPASDVVVAMVLSRPGPLFDLLGARYWIVPGPRQEPPGWKTVGQLPSGFVYENPGALPRAFLVGRSINLVDGDERLKFLAGPGFDAHRMVVLEREGGGLPDGGDTAAAKVGLAAMEPGLYSLRAENEADAYLVLSEAWYPGWRVEVDGAPAELLRANHLMQAVRLPAGKHEVRFSYHPRFLGLGFALAAAAALVPLALLALRMRRK